MLGRIRRWYEGDYVVPDNPPGSPLVFVTGDYKRHWTSQVTHAIVDFCRQRWRRVAWILFGAFASALAAKLVL